ncbi:MAG: sodium:calcium antiporter [Candidatus Omnitrophica bacterium]|nr:sodium:calcium antiporter [Candidatus Omnitrophota bacterium]
MILLPEFIICSILIITASHFVCRYGKDIAIKMNWREGFVGVLFLAFATSLPELSTSLSSIPKLFAINNVNLGFGDAIGSLIINMMLIGFLDFFQGRGRILLHAEKDNILTGTFTMLLLATLAIFSFLRQIIGPFGFYFFGVGIESFLILGFYLLGMKITFRNRHVQEKKSNYRFAGTEWIKFVILLIIIFALGIWLASIGKRISESTSINQSFIGAFILAFSTSLPELAVSISALKMGSIDMAIANILGSNFFDVCIIPLMDIVYRSGPILESIAPVNIFITVLALVLTAIVVAGLSVRSKDTRMKLGWDTASILTLGAIGYYVIYRVG